MFIYTHMGTYTHIYVHIYTERGLIQDQCRISKHTNVQKLALEKLLYIWRIELNI